MESSHLNRFPDTLPGGGGLVQKGVGGGLLESLIIKGIFDYIKNPIKGPISCAYSCLGSIGHVVNIHTPRAPAEVCLALPCPFCITSTFAFTVGQDFCAREWIECAPAWAEAAGGGLGWKECVWGGGTPTDYRG